MKSDCPGTSAESQTDQSRQHALGYANSPNLPEKEQHKRLRHQSSSPPLLPDILDFSWPVLAQNEAMRQELFKKLLIDLVCWGFAIIRVHEDPEETTEERSLLSCLASCEIVSRSFFDRPAPLKEAHCSKKCTEGFAGFHRPSAAKEVFRYRFGLEASMLRSGTRCVGDNRSTSDFALEETTEETAASIIDSPDSGGTTREFLGLLDATSKRLHLMARFLAQGLLEATGSDASDAAALMDELLEPVPPLPGARLCLSPSLQSRTHLSRPPPAGGGKSVNKVSSVKSSEEQLDLPTPPFDLFYYHNDPSSSQQQSQGLSEEEKRRVIIPPPNCEPHVDPGLVTLIPIAAVPGLEVKLPRRALRRGGGQILSSGETCNEQQQCGVRRDSDSDGDISDRSSYSDSAGDSELSNGIDESDSGGSCEEEGEVKKKEGRGTRWLGVEREVQKMVMAIETAVASAGENSPELSEQARERLVGEHRRRSRSSRLLTVLAGDFLETLSAGLIPAGFHRVVSPPPSGTSSSALSSDSIPSAALSSHAGLHVATPCCRGGEGSAMVITHFEHDTDAALPCCALPRFSMVFDLQPPLKAAVPVELAVEATRELWSRKEAQPPIGVIQRSAGRHPRRDRGL